MALLWLLSASSGTGLENFLSKQTTDTINECCKISEIIAVHAAKSMWGNGAIVPLEN
jgi:hypothetical protein